jgi:3-hydroxyisobutyrate dehydrogenase-like beta-hydroxyacid dehydrogenase
MKIAIVGLGEAGSRFARDLVGHGSEVVGWDPAPRGDVSGIPLAASGPEAVRGADLVLSLNSASAARAVAAEAAPHLRPGAVFADLNTASPRLKEGLAGLVEPTGALFADVSLMGPVPRAGVRTPCLVAGRGAAPFAELMARFGTPVRVVEGPPGSAATRKLLRSIFMKGIAACVIECLETAERFELREWMEGELARELELADGRLLTRLVEGSRQHAARRVDEMRAVVEMERDAGVVPRMTEATRDLLAGLRQETGSAR